MIFPTVVQTFRRRQPLPLPLISLDGPGKILVAFLDLGLEGGLTNALGVEVVQQGVQVLQRVVGEPQVLTAARNSRKQAHWLVMTVTAVSTKHTGW